ncbi:hypothetical protein GCM10022297_13510 [Lactobacillus hamsteri]
MTLSKYNAMLSVIFIAKYAPTITKVTIKNHLITLEFFIETNSAIMFDIKFTKLMNVWITNTIAIKVTRIKNILLS